MKAVNCTDFTLKKELSHAKWFPSTIESIVCVCQEMLICVSHVFLGANLTNNDTMRSFVSKPCCRHTHAHGIALVSVVSFLNH